jgi:hypothetical protein
MATTNEMTNTIEMTNVNEEYVSDLEVEKKELEELLSRDPIHEVEKDMASFMVDDDYNSPYHINMTRRLCNELHDELELANKLAELKLVSKQVTEFEALNRLMTRKMISVEIKFFVEEEEGQIIWYCHMAVKIRGKLEFAVCGVSQTKKGAKQYACERVMEDLMKEHIELLIKVGYLRRTFLPEMEYVAHGFLNGISSISSIVKNVSGALSGLIPGAGVVNKIAGGVEFMFRGTGAKSRSASNQDRPTLPIDHPITTLQQTGQMSLGDGPIAANTLRLAKDTLTPFGGLLPMANDLTVDNVKVVEGLIDSFKVGSATKVGEQLAVYYVTPVQEGVFVSNVISEGVAVALTTKPPITNLAQHFAYYSGDLKLKFYVGSALPHSFRIRISQLPDSHPASDGEGEIQGAYHHVDVTVEEQLEFEYIVRNMSPYAQNLIWESDGVDPIAADRISATKPYFYGRVVITALTPLRTTAVTASEITVAVTMSGHDNFEFAVPIPSKNFNIPLRYQAKTLEAHIGDESISSADQGGILQLGGDVANDTNVTTAREMSETTAVESPTNNVLVNEYFSGVNNVDPVLTDRYVQFDELEINTSMNMGDIIYKLELPKGIIDKIGKTPNVLQFEQYAFCRPNLTIQVKCNSSPFNGGTLVVAVRYYDRDAGRIREIGNVERLLQMPHAKISLSSCNDAYLDIPFESFMYMIPTTNSALGSGLYFATLYIAVLNPLAQADGTSPPIITLFSKFSSEGRQTEFYGLRDRFPLYEAQMEPNRSGEERTEDKEIIDPAVPIAQRHTERVNGESFDLKSMCRRFNKIFMGKIEVDNKYVMPIERLQPFVDNPTDILTIANSYYPKGPNTVGTSAVSLDRPLLMLSLPNNYSTLPLFSVQGKVDQVGQLDNNLNINDNLKRRPLMEHLASAYRFGRGALRYAIQWNCTGPCRMTYRHQPTMNLPKFKPILWQRGEEIRELYTRDYKDTFIRMVDRGRMACYDEMSKGEAFEFSDFSYNGSAIFEVPFYTPAKCLVNNISRSGGVQPYNIKELDFCFGTTQILFECLNDESVLNFDLWRALGDDADFSVFQGFPDSPRLGNMIPAQERSPFPKPTKDFRPTNNLLHEEVIKCVEKSLEPKEIKKFRIRISKLEKDCLEAHMFSTVKTKMEEVKNEVIDLKNNANGMFDKVSRVATKMESAMDWVTNLTDMLKRNFKEIASAHLVMAVNVCNNLFSMVKSENLLIKISNFVSLCMNLGLIAVDKINSLYAVVREYLCETGEMLVAHAGGKESNNYYASMAGILIPGILSVMGVSATFANNRKASAVLKDLNFGFQSANTVSLFFKNNLEFLVSVIKKLTNVFFPETFDLKGGSEELKKWAFDVSELTAGHMDWEVQGNLELKKKCCLLYEQSLSYLTSLPEECKNLRGTVMLLHKKISELYNKIGQRVTSGELEKVPVVVWLYGKPGVGKSYLNKVISAKVAEKANLNTSSGVSFIRGNLPYWNGYRGQPVVVFDDVHAIKDPTVMSTFFADWYGLMTPQPYNIPLADISEKERIAAPSLVLANSNELHNSSNLLLSKDAFMRRIDYLLEFDLSDEFVDKFSVKDDKGVMTTKIVRIPKKSERSEEMEKFLEENKHIKVRRYLDPTKTKTKEQFVLLKDFLDNLIDNIVVDIEDRRQEAIARGKLEVNLQNNEGKIQKLSSYFAHVGSDEEFESCDEHDEEEEDLKKTTTECTDCDHFKMIKLMIENDDIGIKMEGGGLSLFDVWTEEVKVKTKFEKCCERCKVDLKMFSYFVSHYLKVNKIELVKELSEEVKLKLSKFRENFVRKLEEAKNLRFSERPILVSVILFIISTLIMFLGLLGLKKVKDSWLDNVALGEGFVTMQVDESVMNAILEGKRSEDLLFVKDGKTFPKSVIYFCDDRAVGVKVVKCKNVDRIKKKDFDKFFEKNECMFAGASKEVVFERMNEDHFFKDVGEIEDNMVVVKISIKEPVLVNEAHLMASSDVRTKTTRMKSVKLPGRMGTLVAHSGGEKVRNYARNLIQIATDGGYVNGIIVKGNWVLTVSHIWKAGKKLGELNAPQYSVSQQEMKDIIGGKLNYVKLEKDLLMFATLVCFESGEQKVFRRLTPCMKPNKEFLRVGPNPEVYFKMTNLYAPMLDEEVIRVRRNNVSAVELPIDFYLSQVKIQNIRGYDLSLVKLPIRVPPGRDISSSFLDASKRNQLTNDYKIIRYNWKHGYIVETAVNEITFMDNHVSKRITPGGKYVGEFNHCGWNYDWEGKGGECGALLINNPTGMICAIHVAGARSGPVKYGVSTIVNKELWDEFIDDVGVSDNVNVDKMLDVEEKGEFEVKMPEGFVAFGKLKKEFVPHLNTTTAIIPTMIHGIEELENNRAPAVMYSKEKPRGYDVLATGVAKQFNPSVAFLPASLRVVEDQMTHLIASSKPTREVKQCLSFEEAVLGIPGYDYVDALRLDTSAGFPYVRTLNAANKRSLLHVLNKDSTSELIGVHKDFKEDYEMSLKSMKEGKLEFRPFNDFLKDERLPPGKDTRLINGSSAITAVLAKQYFGEFLAALRANRHKVGVMVGINLHGLEWTRMANDLLNKGTNIVCGDYSAFGPTLDPEVIGALIRVINNWYAQHVGSVDKEANKVRECLLDAIHAFHVAGDCVYRTSQGSPSGAVWTAEINSLVNMFYILLLWHEIIVVAYRDEQNPATNGLTQKDFFEHVCLRVYGDDVIMSVSDQLIPYFDNLTLQTGFKVHGITYTDINKKGEVVPFRSIDEATFLKCGFLQHPNRHGLWMACLEKSVIEETALWCRKQKDVSLQELSKEAAVTCIELSYSHGIQYYKRIVEVLTKYYSGQGVTLNFKTWEEIDHGCFDEGKWLVY